MKLNNLRNTCLGIILLALSGCATYKQLTPQDKSSADLMPNSVALTILRKYGIGQVNYLQESPLCGNQRVSVPASDLTEVVFFPTNAYVILRKRNFLCITQGRINNVYTEADAREVVAALRAVGASKLEELKIVETKF